MRSSRPSALAACLLLAVALAAGACGARPDPPMPSALVGTLRGHSHTVTSLALSTDGRRLVSTSRDGTLRVWDAATGAPQGVFSRGWWRPAMWVYAWDVASGTLLGTLRGHRNTVHALAVTADGRTLVSGAADQTLRLWSLAPAASPAVLSLDRTDEPVTRWEGYGIYPGPEVMAVAASLDGRLVASAHRDSPIRLWSLPDGRPLAKVASPSESTYAVVFSRDGRYLYSGGDDNAIYRWDVGRVVSAGR